MKERGFREIFDICNLRKRRERFFMFGIEGVYKWINIRIVLNIWED
jgi:hypothetical protein